MSKYIDTIKKITKDNKVNYFQRSIDTLKTKIENEANSGNNKLIFSLYNIDLDTDQIDISKLQKHFKSLGFKIKDLKDSSSNHPSTQISW